MGKWCDLHVALLAGAGTGSADQLELEGEVVGTEKLAEVPPSLASFALEDSRFAGLRPVARGGMMSESFHERLDGI